MNEFYDQLAPLYHLIYQDWNASIVRQGIQLSKIIKSEWPKSKSVLDVSCGIGTQALALAQNNYLIKASDLSKPSIERAKNEANNRNLKIEFSVCDMRKVFSFHGSGFEVILSADNSIPHLLSDSEILATFKQFFDCLKPGGGVLLTVRDYQIEERGKNIFKPYGVRIDNQMRYVLYQIWDFTENQYDLSFYFIKEDLNSGSVQTNVLRSKYYAISTTRLCELLQEAGFKGVNRMDGVFYQPVIVGTKENSNKDYEKHLN